MRSSLLRRPAALIALIALASLAGCAADDSSSTPIDSGDPLASVRTIGAVGDSFTAGMNACGDRGDCLEASWSVGSDADVESIASRIEETAGARPETVSAAVSGGDLADSLDSLSTVIDAEPELVTVLIGGNDACAPTVDDMTSVDEFRVGFEELVSRLTTELPNARVLALSVPSFETYWQLAEAEPRALALWKRYDFCPSALSGATGEPNADENRAAVTERISGFNAVIAEVCGAAPQCIDDGGALSEHLFTVDELSSIDYIHPSPRGQRVISDIAWGALTADAG